MLRSSSSAAAVLVGLEVRRPFAGLLLRGEKVVETRTYPLPSELLGVPLLVRVCVRCVYMCVHVCACICASARAWV